MNEAIVTSFVSSLEKLDIRAEDCFDDRETLPLYRLTFDDMGYSPEEGPIEHYAIIAGSAANVQRVAEAYRDRVHTQTDGEFSPTLMGYKKVADIPVFLNTIKRLQAKEVSEIAEMLSRELGGGVSRTKIEEATRRALKSR